MTLQFEIIDHGTVWTFEPRTPEAEQWWQENVQDGPRLGRAFAVEHRAAGAILAAILADFDPQGE